MTTKSIMTSDPLTLVESDSVHSALKMMFKHHVRSLPVVDAQGNFVGLFGLRRLMRLLRPHAAQVDSGDLTELAFMPDSLERLTDRLIKAGEKPVVEFLEKRKKVAICSPDTTFPQLLELLAKNKDTSLPVVIVKGEQQRVVGMVSGWEILEKVALRAFGATDDARPAGGDVETSGSTDE